MGTEIGAYDAKTKLPEILRKVESGESFTITNRGRVVADVTPSRTSVKFKTATAIKNILKAKKAVMTDEMLGELKDAGRK